jgi:3-oxoacyl-[acyl-carrier protein] reductase
MEVWDADHRRNLRYIFLGAREVAKRCIARGAPGAIASIASVDGIRASTNHTAYGAAKAGLVHMAQSLSAEWSGHGVRMNVVAPGAITTKRITQQSAPASGPNGLAMVPMQRPGQIPEIAKTLVFLVSDMASYITGQTIAVDGGLTSVGPIDYSGLSASKGVIGAGDEVKKSAATAS